MPSMPPESWYFVDFENLPGVDLAPAVESEARVTLLLGKHQTKLSVEMVHLIQRCGDRLKLVEVGATGHNALDLTLAYYLGLAIALDRTREFVIVSKDNGFAVLIKHLGSQGIAIRQAATLGPAPKPKSSRTGKTAAPFPAKPSAQPLPKPSTADLKFEKLVEFLRHDPKHCPKKLEKLRHVIFTHFSKKLSEAEQTAIVRKLEGRGAISVTGEAVTCLFPVGTK
jgi:hypothetical protein